MTHSQRFSTDAPVYGVRTVTTPPFLRALVRIGYAICPIAGWLAFGWLGALGGAGIAIAADCACPVWDAHLSHDQIRSAFAWLSKDAPIGYQIRYLIKRELDLVIRLHWDRVNKITIRFALASNHWPMIAARLESDPYLSGRIISWELNKSGRRQWLYLFTNNSTECAMELFDYLLGVSAANIGADVLARPWRVPREWWYKSNDIQSGSTNVRHVARFSHMYSRVVVAVGYPTYPIVGWIAIGPWGIVIGLTLALAISIGCPIWHAHLEPSHVLHGFTSLITRGRAGDRIVWRIKQTYIVIASLERTAERKRIVRFYVPRDLWAQIAATVGCDAGLGACIGGASIRVSSDSKWVYLLVCPDPDAASVVLRYLVDQADAELTGDVVARPYPYRLKYWGEEAGGKLQIMPQVKTTVRKHIDR